jgi:hypothetical protein
VIAVGRSKHDLADLARSVDNLFCKRGDGALSAGQVSIVSSWRPAASRISYLGDLNPPTLFLNFLRSYN